MRALRFPREASAYLPGRACVVAPFSGLDVDLPCQPGPAVGQGRKTKRPPDGRAYHLYGRRPARRLPRISPTCGTRRPADLEPAARLATDVCVVWISPCGLRRHAGLHGIDVTRYRESRWHSCCIGRR